MLSELRIHSFRNIDNAQITCRPGIQFFYGENGSGKTALLEAIYFLGLGRSFRTSHLDALIQTGSPLLTLFGSNQRAISAGIEKERNTPPRIQVEHRSASPIQLADFLPIILINTESLDILNKGPLYRRQLIDWGLFHVEQSFRETWQQWVRVMRQRNSALKLKQPAKAHCAWDQPLAKLGEKIHEMRVRFLSRYLPLVEEGLKEFLDPRERFSFDYERGWPGDKSLLETLGESLHEDVKLGFTHFGPHRADLVITAGNNLAREKLSRGQQKLFVCALKTALGNLLEMHQKRPCVYLLDDLQSELDKPARTRFFGLLREQNVQAFVTGVELESFVSLIKPEKDALFHVEQGRVSEITPQKI